MPVISNVNPIKARVVKSLEGICPNEFFDQLGNKIFYRVVYDHYATRYWIPRSSILDDDVPKDVQCLPCFQWLKEALEAHPTYDAITLSNL